MPGRGPCWPCLFCSWTVAVLCCSAKLLSPWKPRRVPCAREAVGGMGAARLGGAEDLTVGEWEGPSVPGCARGQGKHRGFRPPTRDARGCTAASQLPWEGCPHSSRGSAARSQPGGNRTRGLSPQATPPSRLPSRAFPPASGASRQLGAEPAAAVTQRTGQGRVGARVLRRGGASLAGAKGPDRGHAMP